MNSRVRRYLTAIDLGDMNYFYSWWGHYKEQAGQKISKQEMIWNSQILNLHESETLNNRS